MALHPRLQLPTLDEPPSRSGHGFTIALALAVLAAGFAYAMPRAINANAVEDPTDSVLLTPTGSTHTETATTPSPSPTETDDDDGDKPRKENHGAAVSTAAHCDLHGKAHGAFVRSIAHDKDATVAEVEAACAAAMAAAEDGSDDLVKPGRGHSKPPKAKFDDDADDADDADDDGDSADGDSDDEPADTAPDDDDSESGPPDHAKDDKNKD